MLSNHGALVKPVKIDAHIHIALDGSDWRKAKARHANGPDERWIRETLAAYAQAGFTYLRDGGDKWGVCTRAARLAGEYGIRYATPAFPLYPKGQYGSFLGLPFADFVEYRALVEQAICQGATFVKLMLSGILDFDCYGKITSPGLPTSYVAQLVAYAHEKGLPVMAHVNTAALVTQALDAGVDSIEHGLLIDAATCEKLAASNVVWVPTIAPVQAAYDSGKFSPDVTQRICREQVAAVAAVVERGGLVALGSDAGSAGVPHVAGALREHELLGVSDAALQRGTHALVSRFPGC